MPRQVDHEARRRAIVEAVCRIAAVDGLEAVSIGQVATAAGMSKGLVQHYFGTKGSMLAYASTHLKEQVDRRVAARLAAAGPAGSRSAALRTLLLALLPTEDAKSEALAATAFTFHAMKNPELGTRFRAGHRQLIDAIADLVRAAQVAGELGPDLDAVAEAEILLAVVTGIGDALVLGYDTADGAVRVLDYQLARLQVRPAGSPCAEVVTSQ